MHAPLSMMSMIQLIQKDQFSNVFQNFKMNHYIISILDVFFFFSILESDSLTFQLKYQFPDIFCSCAKTLRKKKKKICYVGFHSFFMPITSFSICINNRNMWNQYSLAPLSLWQRHQTTKSKHASFFTSPKSIKQNSSAKLNHLLYYLEHDIVKLNLFFICHIFFFFYLK